MRIRSEFLQSAAVTSRVLQSHLLRFSKSKIHTSANFFHLSDGQQYDQTRLTNSGIKVTKIGLVSNIFLTFGKAAAGVLGNSAAMIADAGHSFADLAGDIVALYTVKYSNKPADQRMQAGYGKIESLGTATVSLMLTGAGLVIGSGAIADMYTILTAIEPSAVNVPNSLALWGAGISIIVKETMYRLTMRVANRDGSPILIANAWHHRSDALSSFVAFPAIAGAMAGVPVLDPIGALVVAGIVTKIGLEMTFSSVLQLADRLTLKQVIEVDQMKLAILSLPGIPAATTVTARPMSKHLVVDISIPLMPSTNIDYHYHLRQSVLKAIKLSNAKHVFNVNFQVIETSNQSHQDHDDSHGHSHQHTEACNHGHTHDMDDSHGHSHQHSEACNHGHSHDNDEDEESPFDKNALQFIQSQLSSIMKLIPNVIDIPSIEFVMVDEQLTIEIEVVHSSNLKIDEIKDLVTDIRLEFYKLNLSKSLQQPVQVTIIARPI